MQPTQPTPPPRPGYLPPALPAKTPPPRPKTPNPMAEWEAIKVEPAAVQNFTDDEIAINTDFADLYFSQAQPGERLASYYKIQSIVSENLTLLSTLAGNTQPLKLSFLSDGHIDTDTSFSLSRAMRGPFSWLSGGNPDDIRNLAVFVQFLKAHYADYRHDNQHMRQEIAKLQAASAGLHALAHLYVAEDKDENLEILNKSVQQLNLCTEDLTRKIEENNQLTWPLLNNMLEEAIVKLKIESPGDRAVQIAGLAQSIQAFDGLNVIERTDLAAVPDDFGHFAACIARLSIGSKPEEYLLKELLLADYALQYDEIIRPELENLQIPSLKKTLEALKADLATAQTTKETCDAASNQDPSDANIKALITAEDAVTALEMKIGETTAALTHAEEQLPPLVKRHLEQFSTLITALSDIKETYQEATKNQLAMKCIKDSGLFDGACKLAGHSIDAIDFQLASAEQEQSSMFKGAKLIAGLCVTGVGVYFPMLSPVTHSLGVEWIKEGLAEAEIPYLQQAQAILAKVDDPVKAKKQIEALEKQVKENAALSDALWSMYNKHFPS